MNPEDRVLVGVITRKRDLMHLLNNRWYRIPQHRMKRGIFAEYLAFFLSGRVFKERSGGIHYYAPITGLELAYRRDLLPKEAEHPRANHTYYRVALGTIYEKTPPVLNPNRRVISFIYTTWDRFVHAQEIADLYSQSDYYVDRVYNTLQDRGIQADRLWTAEKDEYQIAPGLRIMCENGPLDVSAQPGRGNVFMDISLPQDKILAEIQRAIQQHGGPATVNIPMEGH